MRRGTFERQWRAVPFAGASRTMGLPGTASKGWRIDDDARHSPSPDSRPVIRGSGRLRLRAAFSHIEPHVVETPSSENLCTQLPRAPPRLSERHPPLHTATFCSL